MRAVLYYTGRAGHLELRIGEHVVDRVFAAEVHVVVDASPTQRSATSSEAAT